MPLIGYLQPNSPLSSLPGFSPVRYMAAALVLWNLRGIQIVPANGRACAKTPKSQFFGGHLSPPIVAIVGPRLIHRVTSEKVTLEFSHDLGRQRQPS